MFKACIVIPFYRHERALPALIDALRLLGLPCYLVDDGSGAGSEAVVDGLARQEASWLLQIRHASNQGKGSAVRTGFEAAFAAGFSHAVQIDADHQHDPADIPRLLALSRANPQALVTGIPVYDKSVPKARLYGRYLTHAMVWLNTLSFRIRDSMCGFRVYPIAAALAVWRTQPVGTRMQFDTDIMVRLYWDGTTVLSMPTAVTYPADGVSHFRMWRDNVGITCMHIRLFFGMLRRLPRLMTRA